jgi:choline-sulfatase
MSLVMASTNILVCIMDHLSQRALGCYHPQGTSPLAKTPNIDALAASGLKYDQVYCATPLCQPSRASFWSGQYPHVTGTLSNGRNHVNQAFPSELATLGDVFQQAGYETVHFGKTHDNGALRGFKCAEVIQKIKTEGVPEAFPEHYDSFQDYDTVEKIVEWLGEDHAQPFLAVADLNNPHDICNWIGYHNSQNGPTSHVDSGRGLPPLPDNFEIDDMATRPLPVQYICCSHQRLSQAAKWTDLDYRHYLAAFGHYVEKADENLGTIMNALEESGQRENTIVVLMADHGDGMASHRMVTKQVSFYEETNKVPFILSGGHLPKGKNDARLGSLLDLFPTCCDLADLPIPQGLPGVSLLSHTSAAQNKDGQHGAERDMVIGQWHTEWGFTVSPGRMVRTKRYKYTHYLEGQGEELYDLIEDPGEKQNLARQPEMVDVLNDHRRRLKEYTQQHSDPYFQLEVQVDPRWRSHALGYQHHDGLAACMV